MTSESIQREIRVIIFIVIGNKECTSLNWQTVNIEYVF